MADEAQGKLLDQMNMLLAGEETENVFPVLAEVTCIGCCTVVDSKTAALELAGQLHAAVLHLIEERYEFYRSQSSSQPDEPSGRA